MIPDDEFCRWAARALIDQLRCGETPARLTARSLVWEPMLQFLWGEVTAADRDLILDLLDREPTRMYGALLSRGLLDDAEVTRALERVFGAERDDERKLGLFHQLVARPLSAAAKERLATWAEANARQLIDDQRRFFADGDVRNRLDSRMGDPRLSEKRWVYLYSAHALGDPALVRSFIEAFAHDADPLMARAASASLAVLVPAREP